MPPPISLVWFRRDLRVLDNAALTFAANQQTAVIPIFIWENEEPANNQMSSSRRWWLLRSLRSLDSALRRYGSRLIVRVGDPFAQLTKLVHETGAETVYWNRQYDTANRKRDDDIQAILRQRGVTVDSFNSSLLREPDEVKNRQGGPYKVFTPFWKACLGLPAPSAPVDLPCNLTGPRTWPDSTELETLHSKTSVAARTDHSAYWTPGCEPAVAQLNQFLDGAFTRYERDRDFPESAGTSRLSPHLHFGEIGPRQIWQAVQERKHDHQDSSPNHDNVFLKQLGWREFAHHILYHFPHTAHRPLRAEFESFPWQYDAAQLEAWKSGQTGYPIVDAGMRELKTTGWMHNRVRMIVGSFLTKHLLMSWKHGADHFQTHLFDADLANNTLGWQWISGCGADAAPYYRIFNPILQGRKFDPEGSYVKRWVPELSEMSHSWIHQPWLAPHTALSDAAVELGTTYPRPIVDHADARQSALEAFATLKHR